jgi:transposase
MKREVSSCVALVAPVGRLGPRLYARHFVGSIQARQVVQALRYFRRRVGRPLLVVWDRLQAHRSAKVKRFVEAHPRDFQLHFLPPYAPDLNPEEGCNSAAKEPLKNLEADSVEGLRRAVRASFRRLGRDKAALRGFFRHAGLTLN